MKTIAQHARDINERHMHVQSLLAGFHLQYSYTSKISKQDAVEFEKLVVELEDSLDSVIQAVHTLADNSSKEKSYDSNC